MSQSTSNELKAEVKLTHNGARRVTTEIISAYRATSVVDTPMRKVEVLEAQDGRVILRATEYRVGHADVMQIHLENYEAHALAGVIENLEGQDAKPNGKTKVRA
jgi:hypothetical protein